MAAALLSGCHRALPAKPLDQLSPREIAGRTVYQANCAACHYDRQPGALHGPSLQNIFQKPYLPSGAPASEAQVTNTIVHGRNNMPALGDKLGTDDLADLQAYLHTL